MLSGLQNVATLGARLGVAALLMTVLAACGDADDGPSEAAETGYGEPCNQFDFSGVARAEPDVAFYDGTPDSGWGGPRCDFQSTTDDISAPHVRFDIQRPVTNTAADFIELGLRERTSPGGVQFFEEGPRVVGMGTGDPAGSSIHRFTVLAPDALVGIRFIYYPGDDETSAEMARVEAAERVFDSLDFESLP